MEQRKILVTSALPYANGPIHIGHLVEYIQTDIWVRFQKMGGHECYYICASDAHGTPIMLRAEEEKIPAEELIKAVSADQQKDFSDFAIQFDNFHTTHSKENKEIVERIYESLVDNGHIKSRMVEQFYDPVKNMFLPDRFIRGTCPSCRAEDQYGDSCEKCGATYSPLDLIDPKSSLTSVQPEIRESNHLFFTLGSFTDVLKRWMVENQLHANVKNKLEEWFDVGLKDWDISRDEPYFGFEIPDQPGKYFYVWLDAPIGYLGSLKNFCDKNEMDFESLTREPQAAEMYHFVGKDIMYFHTLFWPALLSASGFNLPKSVFVHGFLTINGQKMSKSRGTFITAKKYLEHLDPEHLRYYFAAKIGAAIEDIDLNFKDYTYRVNADLVGKFVNIGSRCAGFIEKNFDRRLSLKLENPELLDIFQEACGSVTGHYEKREYRKAVRVIMTLADEANKYIDSRKPWNIAKMNPNDPLLQEIATQGLILFRILAIYLKPVLPRLVEKVEHFFEEPAFSFLGVSEVPLGRTIKKFSRLTTRIKEEDTEKLLITDSEGRGMSMEDEKNDREGHITLDDFLKLDLRIATVVGAKQVEGSHKLLELQLELGDGSRTVFAGIKNSYDPSELLGKKVVCVANLKPRKMRFGLSEGMVLAASDDESDDIFLVSPDGDAQAGMSVK